MALEKDFQSEKGQDADLDDLALLRAELPNGGARIVSQDQSDKSKEASAQVADINLEEDVPVLMDPVQVDDDIGQGNGDQLQFESLIPGDLLTGQADLKETKQSTAVRIAEKAARPEKLFVLSLFSKKDDFNGQYLLESLVTCGFQFGAMDIFHYVDDESGEPIFSLVNAVEPGTFDPNTMDQLTTPGVSLYIKLHELDDPVAGFGRMIETVKQLAVELNAAIKDSKQNAITDQALEHEMQMIREYSARYP
jgi:cell division protein ZipA